MADTVQEVIIGELMDRLEELTESNGYQFNIGRIVRPTRVGWTYRGELVTLAHLDVILLQQGRVRKQSMSANVPLVEWIMTLDLIGVVLLPDTDTNPIDTIANRFAGDIEKAAMQDVSQHESAINTTVVSDLPFEIDEGEFGGRGIRVEIEYRTAENDPFTNRLF